MTLFFRYKSIQRPKGNVVKAPHIPINLISKSSMSIEFIALLDSGADVSIIPQDVAELLGIDLTKEREISRGIGGEVEVINTKIKINIKKGHETYDFLIPVQVAMGGSKIPVIIGRAGFFDRFRITFDQANETVSLKRTTDINL